MSMRFLSIQKCICKVLTEMVNLLSPKPHQKNFPKSSDFCVFTKIVLSILPILFKNGFQRPEAEGYTRPRFSSKKQLYEQIVVFIF